MTTFHLADEVCAAFPDARVVLLTARGVRGGQPWPAASTALAELERRYAAGDFVPADESDPRIAGWHAAYRRFGSNPRRMRPSVDALCRRLVRTGGLPRIGAAVDCYNLVSVSHGFPAGAFDLSRIAGDVAIRFARDGDEFTPLGEPDAVERPRAGEVVYADAAGVLTRHWNHRDAERTKVTPQSRDVVFLLETVDAETFGAALAAAARELADLVGPHAGQVTEHVLDGERRVARLAGDVPLVQHPEPARRQGGVPGGGGEPADVPAARP